MGYLGVDNPRRNSDQLLLLSVIASVCCNEISNIRMEKTNGIIGMTAIAAAHLDDKERVRDSLQKTSQASKHTVPP